MDGQTADEYAAHLDDNLRSLLERAKSGTYRAPPVRRAYIPKDSGEMRPLSIPTFEDKALQRAVAMVLQAVYEQRAACWTSCRSDSVSTVLTRPLFDRSWSHAAQAG